jgi:integrase
MPRKRQDARLNTRSARAKLKQRSEPYWRNISKGLAVGYFKGAKGGTWIARQFCVSTGRRKTSLGVVDDFMDADGVRVLSFDQAQTAAQKWCQRLLQEDTGEVIIGSYTVGQAMADYLKDRERTRRKELSRTRSVINAHIVPSLGSIELSKLTHGKVKAWRDHLAEARPRVRSKRGTTGQVFREIDVNDPEVMRKRQATANRILTVLKAALNHAYRENRVGTKTSWDKITAFREVDVPKIRYLTVNECKRLIDACPTDFRALVRGALYTGCRYGELTALRVDAFNPHSNTIHIEHSKSGKGRYIPLTTEGAAFFHSIADGRKDSASLFTHADGRCKSQQWEHSQQRYWMDFACATAEITPSIGFHILRHTYASQLAMNGTPMPVIASLLGHADTRMTEKHYGHLAPSYVSETLRANLPGFGFEPHLVPQLIHVSA